VEYCFYKTSHQSCQKSECVGFKRKVENLIAILQINPYQNPSPYEKLIGDLAGAYSRRINLQHCLVYEVIEEEITVKILRIWTHYE